MNRVKPFHFLMVTAFISSVFIVLQSNAAFHWTQLASIYTDQPDLFVLSADVQPDRYNQVGGATSMVVAVRNNGTATSARTQLNIHGSRDGICRSSRNLFKTVTVDPIAPNDLDTYTIFDPASLSTLYAAATLADPAGQPTPRTSQTRLHLCAFLEGDTNAFAADSFLGIRADDITYFPWDVNGDGSVTPADAIYVVNRVDGGDILADFDGNGSVSPQEALDVIGRLGYTVNTSVDD